MLTPPTTEPSPPTTATPAAPANALSSGALVKAIKNELHRVGCYSGAIDDKWTSAETKSSLDRFAKFAKLAAAPSNPDTDLLDTLRGKTDRVCPLDCGVREVVRNGQCVAKACPSGTALDDDGSCTKPAKKTATLTDEKRSPAPAADGRAAAASYDPYDRSRRVTPGGQMTCGPNGCERVPVGCQAIRGMPGGRGLGGSYKVDDEGVRAAPVTVVDKGTLVNYLIGRAPIRDFPVSNGHGRASGSGNTALHVTWSLVAETVLIGSYLVGSYLNCWRTSASDFLARSESHSGSTMRSRMPL